MRSVLNRFGLARPAFTKEIEADDLFAAPAHVDAVARLRGAIEAKASGPLVGESGVGKTCVLRALQRELNPARYRVTYLHHANVSPRDFYRQLSMILGLEPKAHPSAMFRQVQAHMEDLADEQKIHPCSSSMRRSSCRRRCSSRCTSCSTSAWTRARSCRSSSSGYRSCASGSPATCSATLRRGCRRGCTSSRCGRRTSAARGAGQGRAGRRQRRPRGGQAMRGGAALIADSEPGETAANSAEVQLAKG